MNLFGDKTLGSFSKHVASSSALNPTLLLSVLAVAGGYTLTYLMPPPLTYVAFTVGTLPVLIGCWQIVKFTNGDTDRLQHDTHVERKMLISLMGENSENGTRQVIIDHDSPLSENPQIKDGEF